VVRLGPNELSFTNAQAWTDIYGMHALSWGTQGQMPKYGGSDSYEEGFGRLNMTNATVEDHTRMRRMVSHAFSDRAMRDVEPIVQQYVGLLVERLGERCDKGEDVDAVAWMNFTTFDLMGDLAFSDDFECLKKGVYNPW
jgi:cytochrome P450